MSMPIESSESSNLLNKEPVYFSTDHEFPDCELVDLNGSLARDANRTRNGQKDWEGMIEGWKDLNISSLLKASFQPPPAYNPLSPNHIRVLELNPAHFNAPLAGSFLIVPLDTISQYNALSYTWGDPTPTSYLQVNEESVEIADNLEAALRHIRSPTEIIKLWIDAICINQNDLAEKNHQVMNMGRIYRNAQRVLVWLGMDGDCHGQRAFEQALKIANDAGFRKQYLTSWISHPTTRYLKELTCRQWFHRTWTCQEIGLATRATFLTEHYSINWDTLYKAFWMIEEAIGLEELKQNAFHTDRVTFLYHSFSHASFGDLLLHTRERTASERRDKVFALLSHPTASDPETGKSLIEVDYGKPVFTVYAEATMIMIRDKGYLDDISFAESEAPLDPSWPSWVPMWYKNPRMGCMLSRPEASSYQACGKYNLCKPELHSAIGGQTMLTVTGFKVDTILACRSVDPYTSHSDAFNFLRRIWANISTLASCHYGDKTLHALSLCLTLPWKSLASLNPDFNTSWKEFWERSILREPHQRRYAGARQIERLQQIYPNRTTHFRAMKLFVTRNGLLGMGSKRIQEGGVVVVLRGGRIPYILRPDGPGCFKLISECFTPFLMQGEIEHLVDQHKTTLESFKIS